MNRIITIYVTHANESEAEKIVSYLLTKRLVACANFFPIKSMYWWKGSLEKNDEIVTLFKTREGYFEMVKQEILEMHPYDTPCIIKLDSEANDSYIKWVYSETII